MAFWNFSKKSGTDGRRFEVCGGGDLVVDEDDDGEVEVSAGDEVDDMMITMMELLVGLRCWEDCRRRAVQRRDWGKSVGGRTGVRGVAFSLHQMPRWTRRYKIDKS